jgi:hypothetical protein
MDKKQMGYVSKEWLKEHECQIFMYQKGEDGSEGVLPVSIDDLPDADVIEALIGDAIEGIDYDYHTDTTYPTLPQLLSLKMVTRKRFVLELSDLLRFTKRRWSTALWTWNPAVMITQRDFSGSVLYWKTIPCPTRASCNLYRGH